MEKVVNDLKMFLKASGVDISDCKTQEDLLNKLNSVKMDSLISAMSAAKLNRKKKVTIIAMGSTGDVYPLIGVGVALAAKGKASESYLIMPQMWMFASLPMECFENKLKREVYSSNLFTEIQESQ
jgi:hypothetical protein